MNIKQSSLLLKTQFQETGIANAHYYSNDVMQFSNLSQKYQKKKKQQKPAGQICKAKSCTTQDTVKRFKYQPYIQTVHGRAASKSERLYSGHPIGCQSSGQSCFQSTRGCDRQSHSRRDSLPTLELLQGKSNRISPCSQMAVASLKSVQ